MNDSRRPFRIPIHFAWGLIALGALPAIVVANSNAAPHPSPTKAAAVFAMEVDTNRADGTGVSQAACLQAAASTATRAGYVRVASSGAEVSAASATGERTLTITCPAVTGDPAYPYAMVSLTDAAWKSKSDRAADAGLQAIVGGLHEDLARE